MKGRSLDTVRIAFSRDTVVIPWESRQRLLEELRKLPSAREVVERFEAVGTSQPVKLSREGKALLLNIVTGWLEDPTVAGAPPGISELRNALIGERGHGELDPLE